MIKLAILVFSIFFSIGGVPYAKLYSQRPTDERFDPSIITWMQKKLLGWIYCVSPGVPEVFRSLAVPKYR